MKKKGFTLVEILAVLVIIAAIATISVPSIINYINNKKNEVSEVTKELIFSGAELYVDNDNSIVKNQHNIYCVTLKEIVDADYLEAPIIDSVKNSEISLSKYVKIEYNYDEYLKLTKPTYELVDNCTQKFYTCIPANNSNKTAGNIPSGNYNLGDEYLCEVKPGTEYHFFIVSTEGEKVNLIMDSNINSDGQAVNQSLDNKGLVAWINKEDYDATGGSDWNTEIGNSDKGPITALKYLDKATEDWTSIPYLSETYVTPDRTSIPNSLGTYVTQGTSDGVNVSITFNGRTRLLKKEEIACLWDGECEAWLITNLDTPENERLNGVYGYWTLEPYNKNDVWDIDYNGYDTNGTENILVNGSRTEKKVDGVSLDYYCGVRAVITVNKNEIKN